jgi:uncharacterized membrane protein
MFAALSTAMIQGILPSTTDYIGSLLYGIFGGLSFTCLFLTIVICVEILLKSSRFVISRAKKYTTELNKKREEADRIITSMKEKLAKTSRQRCRSSSSLYENAYNSIAGAPVDESSIFSMEEAMREALNDRKKIQKSLLMETDKFDEYWRLHCKPMKEAAVVLFYAGTMGTMAAMGVFAFEQFSRQYRNTLAAALCVLLMALSAVFFALIVRLRLGDHQYLTSPDVEQSTPTYMPPPVLL